MPKPHTISYTATILSAVLTVCMLIGGQAIGWAFLALAVVLFLLSGLLHGNWNMNHPQASRD